MTSGTQGRRLRASVAALTISAAVCVAGGAPTTVSAVGTPDRVHDGRPVEALPPGSVRHQNSRYWVWFGPRNWLSVDNPNGILITSATNRLRLDEGFSSIFCANGATVADSVNNYFADQRRTVFRGFRQTWRNVRMTASNIRRLPEQVWGPLYFRQTLEASGTEGGVPYRSVVRLDYSLASGPQRCVYRNVAMTAPARGFNQSLAVLRSVQASKAYFPPGVPR